MWVPVKKTLTSTTTATIKYWGLHPYTVTTTFTTTVLTVVGGTFTFSGTGTTTYGTLIVTTQTLTSSSIVADTETVTYTFTYTITVPYTTEEAAPPSGLRCLVASAAYGSELADEVQFLRSFRDDKLLRTFAGSQFMTAFNSFYYSFSPSVAEAVSNYPLLREAVKALLYPLLGILYASTALFSQLSFNGEFAAVASGFLASSLIGAVYFAPLVIAFSALVGRRRLCRIRSFMPLLTLWAFSLILIAAGEAMSSGGILSLSTAMFVLSTLSISALLTASGVLRKLAFRGWKAKG